MFQVDHCKKSQLNHTRPNIFQADQARLAALVCIIYIILLIYARLKDKKDLKKLGVTVLPENYRSDHYYYQILVFTGHKKDAGTKSQVQFIPAGYKDETHVRTFADLHRAIFQPGGIDAFLMAVPK